MNQAQDGTGRKQDDRRSPGPSGWLGVVLVVVAGARYVVLAEIHGDEAVILDPVTGRFTMPVSDLAGSVGDAATMWLPNP